MKICYFGIYNSNYNRNRVLISGLRENGVEVIECQSDLKGFAKYFDLVKKHWPIRNNYDAMVVGFPGQGAMILARLIARQPIIFDAFLSLYDSMVFDRGTCRPQSLRAKYFWFLDWISCRLSDKILLDTEAHIEYFIETFKIKRKKLHRLFVGADNGLVYPIERETRNDFVVHFHGHFIPLQGIDHIIGAAKKLENEKIRFNIIGRGQEYEKSLSLARDLGVKNIDFVDNVPYDKLKDYMSQSDICLGVFGDVPKTQRVIPNKVYEAIACAKAVITLDSPAIRELFTDGDNIILISGDKEKEQDLADKILALKFDGPLREKIAQNGYRLYLEKLTPKVLGSELLKIINN